MIDTCCDVWSRKKKKKRGMYPAMNSRMLVGLLMIILVSAIQDGDIIKRGSKTMRQTEYLILQKKSLIAHRVLVEKYRAPVAVAGHSETEETVAHCHNCERSPPSERCGPTAFCGDGVG